MTLEGAIDGVDYFSSSHRNGDLVETDSVEVGVEPVFLTALSVG